MLMSMNVFHQTTPKMLSVSSHGRRIPPHSSSSSSSHALVSSPATSVKLKPKFLQLHGIASCKPLLASPATMRFSPVFELPRDNQESSSDNEEGPIIQEDDEERGTSISSDNVKEEQLKKVSGEVTKLEFLVREATLKEFREWAWLTAEGPYEYPYQFQDCFLYLRKQPEQEYDLLLKRYENPALEPFTWIIAVRKEGENVLNGMFENVSGTLDFHVKYHPKKHGIISNVTVAKSARQQGVGSSMLKFAIEYAKENGIPQIFLQVRRDNNPALALFGKMGFTISAAKTTPLQEEPNMYTCNLDL